MCVDWCPRPEEELIELNSSLAQVVIGVRRSGKSTLCINVIKNSGLAFGYVNFEDERLNTLNSKDLNTILECLYQIYGEFNHLFLDEIQNIEGWQYFVNRLLRTGRHILMTGSNAKLLSSELSTHMTGRYLSVELFPFSFSEYCKAQNISTLHETTKERGLLRRAFDSYVNEMKNKFIMGVEDISNDATWDNYVSTLETLGMSELQAVYQSAYDRLNAE